MGIERPGQFRLGHWPEPVRATFTLHGIQIDTDSILSAEERAELGASWLSSVLAPMAARVRLPAQRQLFQPGDCASSYYLVESGELLAHRRPICSKSMIRNIREDELFILDCDGRHVVTCDAITDCALLRIDRKLLEGRARRDPVMKGLLQSVHANELSFILRCLGADDDGHDNDLAAHLAIWSTAAARVPPGTHETARSG
jgi:CRP-like cAMP-binding protein